MVSRVTGSVKIIRFGYSNKDTKDEEGRELVGERRPLSVECPIGSNTFHRCG